MSRIGKKSSRHVRIDKLLIVADGQFVADLSNQVLEVNIYQDLYEPFLTCDVMLKDALALYTIAPRSELRQPGFTGHDIMMISYSTTFPGDDIENKKHAFALYNVAARTRSEEKSETMILQGISIEGWYAIDKKISRSYGHRETTQRKKLDTINNYVKSITEEFLYSKEAQTFYNKVQGLTKISIKKNNTYDPTKSRIHYIVPNLHPTAAIDCLISESDNDKDVPLFTFYEDSDGFHFADITKLVLRKPVDTFTYEPSNYNETGAKQNLSDLKKIQTYEIIKQTNILEAKMEGLFKSRTINIDVLKKNKKEVVYDYYKSGPKFSKLNSGNLPHEHLISGTSGSDAMVTMITSRSGHDNYKLFESERHLPKLSNLITNKTESYIQHLSNIMLSVSLNGDTQLNVGNIINLIIPPATTIGTESKVDKYLSGYYMITKLRNIIVEDAMTTIVEVIKDTEGTAPTTQPHKG